MYLRKCNVHLHTPLCFYDDLCGAHVALTTVFSFVTVLTGFACFVGYRAYQPFPQCVEAVPGIELEVSCLRGILPLSYIPGPSGDS